MITNESKLSQNGFTLVEVMISLVLISFISLTTLSFLNYIRIDTREQESVTYRNNETSQFFMQMVQPQYVGALADFADNKELLQCLEADGHLCDTTTSYPLVAYDLATAKPVLHLDSGAAGLVTTELSFKVHCPLEKPSCDAVDYINITIKTSILGNYGLSLVNEKVVTVEPKRTNVLTFVPNTVVEDGAPANIVLFVDGSNSMSSIKASFKSTLTNFLNSIQNMDWRMT
jgi:prepilin-type N-terminal cleavage/methylation domain-containing protein